MAGTAGKTWLTEEIEQLAAGGASPGELLGALPREVLRDAIAVLARDDVALIPPQNQFAALQRVLQTELDSRA